jgi:hypothetical protein
MYDAKITPDPQDFDDALLKQKVFKKASIALSKYANPSCVSGANFYSISKLDCSVDLTITYRK